MDNLVITKAVDNSLITALPGGLATYVDNPLVVTPQTGNETLGAGSVQPYVRLPIIGTNASEIVQGTDGDNTIWAMGGDDLVYGWNGNDDIDGGEGDDIIYGGFGNDTLTGGGGSNIFRIDTLNPGEVDTIVDFHRLSTVGSTSRIPTGIGSPISPSPHPDAWDTIQISASGFGGTLRVGQKPNGAFDPPASYSESFCFRYLVEGLRYLEEGAPNADAPVGISTFGYSEQDGSLYYDLDGGGTAAVYQRFAQLPANAHISGVQGEFIQIVA